MRKLCLFFGQRRCGNHGMIEWCSSQINQKHGPKAVAFLNNKEPGKVGPQTKKAFTKSRDFQWVFVSYEDRYINKINFNEIIPNQQKLAGNFDITYNVLLLRDPFNLFASRMKHPTLAKKFRLNPQPTVDLWITYAREYLGETNYLPNKICMNFNEWFSSKNYRKKFCKNIGFPFSDTGLNRVHDEGKGSSFDGMKFNEKAQQMKVLDRWRVFVNNKDYLDIMKNSNLISLSERIFGKIDVL